MPQQRKQWPPQTAPPTNTLGNNQQPDIVQILKSAAASTQVLKDRFRNHRVGSRGQIHLLMEPIIRPLWFISKTMHQRINNWPHSKVVKSTNRNTTQRLEQLNRVRKLASTGQVQM